MHVYNTKMNTCTILAQIETENLNEWTYWAYQMNIITELRMLTNEHTELNEWTYWAENLNESTYW